ncbi:MAG: hypothetical protein E7Z94_01530 [Actinomyces ruminicola]|uniref:Uncharacterized protein n=1 Tax=Actinomyces ruminicola TaxID=332524 RepID=A0A1H0D541_9ACTO|nr:hypothetical protein [Actinomyces ruminicola]MBE6481059.1 hypothetical protein [Actinomyces ruminicola]SDM58233.1 hypothetical protein SAMN04487766_10465 [Actinomyces ruminicola]SDN65284.1 hypothetical protein SAMN05216355_10927 [Actinomyces ruminicola]
MHGFDPQQLPANHNWLWLFANVTLVCLIVLNVILIREWRRQRRQEQLARFGPHPANGRTTAPH